MRKTVHEPVAHLVKRVDIQPRFIIVDIRLIHGIDEMFALAEFACFRIKIIFNPIVFQAVKIARYIIFNQWK